MGVDDDVDSTGLRYGGGMGRAYGTMRSYAGLRGASEKKKDHWPSATNASVHRPVY